MTSMARSNGFEPLSGAGTQAAAQQAAHQQPAQGLSQAGTYPATQQYDAYGQPVYAQGQTNQHLANQQMAYQQPAYQQSAYQQAAAVPGYGLTPQPQARPAAANYAPQFDPYVPQSQGQGASQGQLASQSQAGLPAYRQQAAAAAPEFRGAVYDQWAGQQQPSTDPRGFDLSTYGQTPYAQSGYAPSAQGQTAQQAGYGTQYGYQQAPSQDYAAAQQGYAQDPAYAQQGQVGAEPEQDYDEGDDYADEVPNRSRSFMVMAALAGAIVVGGGLTYGYNSLLGGGASGPTPLVKSAEGPSKVKPSEPGGKQFAHSDSKVLGRLSENGASTSDVDGSGAKRVSTLVVKPDGTIAPPVTAPAEAATASMPGMSVVNVGGPPMEVPSAVAAVVETASTAVASGTTKPLVVTPPVGGPSKVAKAINAVQTVNTASVNAVAAPSDLAAVVPAAAPAVVAKKPEVVKKVAALAVPAATEPVAKVAAAAPTVATGTGYMAVIASVPANNSSRVSALARWADMQQKYGTILQSKQPDVQEANLGEKGTYHRLLVGPPGSKDGANTVCSQLKAAGHTDCWVMAF
jgi:SPOR domain